MSAGIRWPTKMGYFQDSWSHVQWRNLLKGVVPGDEALRSCAVFRPLRSPIISGVQHFAIDRLNHAPLILFTFLSGFCSDLISIRVNIIISQHAIALALLLLLLDVVAIVQIGCFTLLNKDRLLAFTSICGHISHCHDILYGIGSMQTSMLRDWGGLCALVQRSLPSLRHRSNIYICPPQS